MQTKYKWRESADVLDDHSSMARQNDDMSIIPAADAVPTIPESLPPVIPLSIARDLAVQLVGSDAGKYKRSRPTTVMTKGATPEDLAAVETAMEPFLLDEIKRFHEDPSHRPECRINATPNRARALKAFCLAYAAHLRKHLDRHDNDDRHHRSQQRLDQAYSVISQINLALGTAFDDGLTLQECEKDLTMQMRVLQAGLDGYKTRATARPENNRQDLRTVVAAIDELSSALLLLLARFEPEETGQTA